MKIEEIEKDSIETYTLNMEYLKNNHKNLYEKINLFELGLNNNLIKTKYELDYKDGYFDILDLENKTYFYNQNSETYGKNAVEKQLSFSPKVCSFKAFYEVDFDDDVVNIAENASMYSSALINNAPVIHYVNSNLPKKEIMKAIPKMILFGIGLGTHISYIHTKVKSRIYLIIEPNLEFFRLSLFTFKYYNLAKSSQLFFSVSENEASFDFSFDSFYKKGFIYNHYFKHFMFSKNCQMYIDLIQSKLVSQNHITYDYSRKIESMKRSTEYIKKKYKILNITPYKFDKFNRKPILFLAAGPSLQKNMDFLKTNKNKYVIVAVYIIIPLLEKNNIVPDIVTQYDQAGDVFYNEIKKINDIRFFDKTIFIFASHVDKRVVDSFPAQNIFIFQAMYDIKKGFESQTSPSIGELTYALLLRLGAKEIYLLGLDMALDYETNKTHVDEHIYSQNILEKERSNRFTLTKDILKVKGNLRDTVNTTSIYKKSIESLDFITKSFLRDTVYVYNLSDGAFFQKIIPLKIEDIDLSKFKELNKSKLIPEIIQGLNVISEKGFNENDKELISLKIEESKKIKEKVKTFFKTKDSNLLVYEKRLGSLINELCFTNSVCIDLQDVLVSYIMNNVHYVYHLINMKSLENPKKQLKTINKILQKQLLKITETYIEIYT